jgi:hypothetical protein
MNNDSVTTNDALGGVGSTGLFGGFTADDATPPRELEDMARKWASDRRVMIGAIRLAWERGEERGIPTSLTGICDAYQRSVRDGWVKPNVSDHRHSAGGATDAKEDNL